jgi:hypothetical protein
MISGKSQVSHKFLTAPKSNLQSNVSINYTCGDV